MTPLIIGSTSFLNPGHKAWLTLKNAFDVSFGKYGDLASIASEDLSGCSLGFIAHLNDLLTYKEWVSETMAEAKLQPLLSLLDRRCRQSNQPTIFCISSANAEHIVRSAKKISPAKNIQFWLLRQLEFIALKYASFYFIDLDDCFSHVGFDNAFDSRNWYFAHARNSSKGLHEIVNAIHKVLFRHHNPPSKVFILDCDNTLWGGVIGEDGLHGILLGTDGIGKAFLDFQKEIKKLVKEGVILILASKNNEADVWEVFDKHQSMILRRNDIVAHKINWREKSANILELEQELDLGVNSFVFWDDNPIEREKVRLMVPSVETVEVPDNVLEWPKLIKSLDAFCKFSITDEDQKKTEQYRLRAKFVSESKNITDGISFLKSIKLKAYLTNLNESNIGRAVQLCQKTNQFNLRTIRHTDDKLKEFIKRDPRLCSLASLEDIYGDHGIVGLFCLTEANKQTLFIDTFLLSCRVLGRYYEIWMLSEILKIARSNNYQHVLAEFRPSHKNDVAKEFLEQNGFKQLTNEIKTFLDNQPFNNKPNGIFYSRATENFKFLIGDLYEH